MWMPHVYKVIMATEDLPLEKKKAKLWDNNRLGVLYLLQWKRNVLRFVCKGVLKYLLIRVKYWYFFWKQLIKAGILAFVEVTMTFFQFKNVQTRQTTHEMFLQKIWEVVMEIKNNEKIYSDSCQEKKKNQNA